MEYVSYVDGIMDTSVMEKCAQQTKNVTVIHVPMGSVASAMEIVYYVEELLAAMTLNVLPTHA